MSLTTSMTIAQISPTGVTAGTVQRGQSVMIQTKPLDAQSNPSGARVNLSCSNANVATITPCQVQDGMSEIGILGVGVGNAVITAAAQDGSGITATFNIAVT